jgi:hypothetical protein
MKVKTLFLAVVLAAMLASCTITIPIGLTPTPTPTPTPIPGIGQPVYTEGVSFQFFYASLGADSAAVDVGDQTLTPDPGYAVLIIEAYYTGDPHGLFGNGDIYQGQDVLYISDATGEPKDWQDTTYFTSDTGKNVVEIGFFVKTDASPYILHSTVNPSWTVDLSPLLNR